MTDRDSGEAWVDGDRGRFWGRFGAAGLLAHDPERGLLLQHRATWSDQGGTWGLPGGALHRAEDPVAGALREAHEEAAVPDGHLRVLFTSVFDAGYWSYTTVGARVLQPFEPLISDPESMDLQWVPLPEVEHKPLHSGFSASWRSLRRELSKSRCLVVDAANVVGSRPNGWWRDRKGAAQRLIDSISVLALLGVRSPEGNLDRMWPEIVVVTEGQARGAADPQARVRVVAAEHDGDQAIVDTVRRLRAEHSITTVVTADRGLRSRVEELGASVQGPGWLLDQIKE